MSLYFLSLPLNVLKTILKHLETETPTDRHRGGKKPIMNHRGGCRDGGERKQLKRERESKTLEICKGVKTNKTESLGFAQGANHRGSSGLSVWRP